MRPDLNAKKARKQGAISLNAFAGGRKSTYDKRIKIQRDQNLNARKVNEFRKFKQRDAASTTEQAVQKYDGKVLQDATARGDNEEDKRRRKDGAIEYKKAKKQKKATRLERIHQQNELERQAAQEEKTQAKLQAAEAARSRQAAQKSRKDKTSFLKRKTHKGQPLMKNQIDNLLSKIQSG
ncbi:hypothetical protein CYMTET_7777 [Cymbomonas tetramitiformis]|uniref:rRNA-processing protein FYV7 n=1 Tax=Cymbomonas tetramitiformis TaxID=36881 RepID=A0AAE0LGN1_9CHLO|nr:hypothetical protein CYMTET_7777 [Cymbomonas tetramitiformis]